MRLRLGCLVLAAVASAQTPTKKGPAKPFRQESTASVNYTSPDGQDTVEITNVGYEVTSSYIPGLPPEQRLLLRKTTRVKRVVEDIGAEATTTLEAWPFPSDPSRKPIYSLAVSGAEGHTFDGQLWVMARGLEEVEWWSVYKLGTAQHLFDTYVPLVSFTISLPIRKERYVGLEVPPDDTADARLKDPHVVGVLSYASNERLIREALITCDDAEQARLLRSYADVTRSVSAGGMPARSLTITFRENDRAAAVPVAARVPIANDDLDVAHAQLPAKLHVAAWKRDRVGEKK